MVYPLTAPLLELLILSIVNREDSYGYQISQQLKSVSGIKDSALFPVLKRLSEGSCIEAYDRPFQGRNRKYYRMTENGKTYYQTLAQAWNEHLQAVAQIMEGTGGASI